MDVPVWLLDGVVTAARVLQKWLRAWRGAVVAERTRGDPEPVSTQSPPDSPQYTGSNPALTSSVLCALEQEPSPLWAALPHLGLEDYGVPVAPSC